MPQVRTLRPGQVKADPIPDVRRRNIPYGTVETPQIRFNPSPEQSGAGLGEALQRGAGALLEDEIRKRQKEREREERERQKEREREDQVRILAAEADYSAVELKVLYDPQTGALTTRGRNALGVPDAVNQTLDSAADKIRADLFTKEQQFAFDQMVSRRRQRTGEILTRHVGEQVRAVEDTELASVIRNSAEFAIHNADNPALVAEERQNIREKRLAWADRMGLGREATEALLIEDLTRVHEGVLGQMLAAGHDQEAQLYFGHYKDEIQAERLQVVQKALDEGNLTGESQRRADAIISTAPDVETAIEAARKIEKPKLRDMVENRVKAEWSLRRQLQNETRQEAQAIAKEVLDGQMKQMLNLIDRRKPVFARDVVPPAVWNTLDETDRGHLETYAKRYQETAKEGGIKTNPGVWYPRIREAGADPQKFAARNLLADLPSLSPSDFQELAKLQRSIIDGRTKDVDKVLDDFRTENQIMADSLKLSGIDPGAKENADTVARLHQMVGERAAILQRQTAKKATNADIQAIVDDVLIKSITVDGWIWDSQKPLIQATIKDIPRAERAKVEAALKEAGRPVNDKAILDLYIRTQQRLPAAVNPNTGERLVLRNGKWVKP